MAQPPEPTPSDPSMEDILASIRRILDEEGAKPGADAGEAPAPAAGEPAPPATAEADDVLELDASMMLPDATPAPPSTPAPTTPAPATIHPPELPRPLADPAAAEPAPMVAAEPAPMVAPEAAAAAASSVGVLMRALASERTTAVHRGGPTIEDLVRAELRPLLKAWLDEHLAPTVERLVRAEIERVVSRHT